MPKQKLKMTSGLIVSPETAHPQSETEASNVTPMAGATPSPRKRERRTDQMSIRMKPSTRDVIEALAAAEDEPIAEIIERAVIAYAATVQK